MLNVQNRGANQAPPGQTRTFEVGPRIDRKRTSASSLALLKHEETALEAKDCFGRVVRGRKVFWRHAECALMESGLRWRASKSWRQILR